MMWLWCLAGYLMLSGTILKGYHAAIEHEPKVIENLPWHFCYWWPMLLIYSIFPSSPMGFFRTLGALLMIILGGVVAFVLSFFKLFKK